MSATSARCPVCVWAMIPRVSALRPLRRLSRLPLGSGGPEAAAAAAVLLGAPRGPLRTTNDVQRYFGTNRVIHSKKDGQTVPVQEIPKQAESQDSINEKTKKDLLSIIKGMKVELSTVNVQTTKPPSRRPQRSLEETTGRPQKATEDAPKKSEALSPALVAAADAVAESLPFDKQTTKSELLRQLQQHEDSSRAQKDRARPKISHIISDMKVTKSTTLRANTRPVHQIQFDEECDSYAGPEKTADLRKRKNIFQGKRLNIFNRQAATEEALETGTAPSLWDVEFAKQLAAVNEQPFQNGFEEMIQWTREGKLWEFPVNNEAGFDDDGSEFHEHIFLEKHLEDFPKQGPVRHFMELVACGLSRNPHLSVKQKVEHIAWFRKYFNEKKDVLAESGLQFG